MFDSIIDLIKSGNFFSSIDNLIIYREPKKDYFSKIIFGSKKSENMFNFPILFSNKASDVININKGRNVLVVNHNIDRKTFEDYIFKTNISNVVYISNSIKISSDKLDALFNSGFGNDKFFHKKFLNSSALKNFNIFFTCFFIKNYGIAFNPHSDYENYIISDKKEDKINYEIYLLIKFYKKIRKVFLIDKIIAILKKILKN
jgi:hypothetical protein